MKLLSILLSLVMMLSGGYVAEDPGTAASNIITIRDAVVTIDGQEYPLNPSVTLGAASENGAALLDVGMNLGENVLFPVQVKLSESGLGLVLGESSTVYTFTPAFFDEIVGGEEIPDEITTMMESYAELLAAVGKLDASTMLEQQKASGEKFMELVGDAPAEEATFFANGEEQSGQHVVFTLTNDQLIEYMDFCFEQMPEGYADAYFGYLNTTMSMAGMPEVNGFADILAMSGMEMSIDGDMTYNETSGVAELTFHTVVDPSASTLGTEIAATEDSEIADSIETTSEAVSFDIPMEITVHTPENMEYTMDMDVEGAQLVMNGTVIEGAQKVTMELTAEDEMAMTMDVNVQPMDNAAQISFDMNMEADGVAFNLGVDNTPNEKGSTTECEFSFADEEFSLGAAFAVDVTHDAIADRTAGATVSEINSAEEIESNTGLLMAVMSLAGGAEQLMTDESVAALVEAVQAYTTVSEAYTENTEAAADTSDNSTNDEAAPSALPTPEFAWVPEGYELTEVDQSSDNYASYYFEYTADDDEYHSTLYLDMEASSMDSYGYKTYAYVVTDEGIQQQSNPTVIIERYDDDSVYGDYVLNNEYTFHASYYDSDLSDEDMVRFLTGITLP